MGKIIAIITAAGSGKRLKSRKKKQFLEINDRPLLFWTMDKFVLNENIDDIIVVLPEEEMDFSRQIKNEFPDSKITCVKGGNERQISVYNALKNCPEDTSLVLIHDGVRPFITSNEITDIIRLTEKEDAVIAASKVRDTIKVVSNEQVVKTIPRDEIYQALTPQAFRFKLILYYHNKASADELNFTDDASILEYYGEKVKIYECSSKNIKITDPSDIKMAEKLLTK